VDQKLSAAALRALIKNKSPESGPNKSETYELALRFILKTAMASEGFNKKEFDERPPKVSDITFIALTAADALKAFKK
jgi:hypothetical protein